MDTAKENTELCRVIWIAGKGKRAGWSNELPRDAAEELKKRQNGNQWGHIHAVVTAQYFDRYIGIHLTHPYKAGLPEHKRSCAPTPTRQGCAELAVRLTIARIFRGEMPAGEDGLTPKRVSLAEALRECSFDENN